MAVARLTLTDLKALDADALRTLILLQQEELSSRNTEIDHLKLLILKLKRMQFGRKSEKLDKQNPAAGIAARRSGSASELLCYFATIGRLARINCCKAGAATTARATPA
jgi:hypothetical protein